MTYSPKSVDVEAHAVSGGATASQNCRPWRRETVERTEWAAIGESLAQRQCELLSLWSDGARVYLALLRSSGVRIVSLDCPDGVFPSIARLHPPALRLERAIADLYGLHAQDTPDARRWLDHGRWGLRHPGGAKEPLETPVDAYTSLPVEGEPSHQIPVGPVHAGIIEPGHFRFSANGEIVLRLEERLGYVHKGVDRLMAGAPLEKAARLAARVSGDSTVAYGFAFAQAVEAALGVGPPPRATHLRALMAELERLANHFGDIGAICNDAAFALMLAQCGLIRERLLRAAATCFGHRLMMDRIAPGGVTADLDAAGAAALRSLIKQTKAILPKLVALFGDTTSLQDRTVGAGVLTAELAKQYACGGVVGRASGRAFDARRSIGYAPYGALDFKLGASNGGDVDARVWVRFDEAHASLHIVEQILDTLPQGAIAIPIEASARACESAAFAESFRGEVFVWLRLGADGVVEHCHLRDPSWFQWPLLEAAIKGNIVADFPLLNKSFNCSYSGHDL